MTKSKPTLAGLMLTLFTASSAQAQVSVDVSKITCEQLILNRVASQDKIVIWLSGYHNAKRGNTIVDTKGLEENSKKLTTYCRNNLKVTVMQAVEAMLSASR